MTKCNLEIKPTTEKDVIELFGVPLDITIKAYSVFWQGELSAIAGVTILRNHTEFFCDVKTKTVPPKLTVWRAAKEVIKKLRDDKIKVFSIADPDIESSQRFLKALGFIEDGEFNNMKYYRFG